MMDFVGKTLDGRFAIRERLGAGAMGVVYRATQLSIGRDVAVKLLLELDGLAKKRFLREAQVTSKLAHPNTVHIIEFGETPEGHVYLAMELVKGRTLHEAISDGPLPSRRICRIVSQLCEALDAAHALSIVHRDLKPENIMIADDGTDFVKVLDFGIARVLGDANLAITGAGLSAGTPRYMAPEALADAAPPTPAQDVYALGVVIAEMTLGRTLWDTSALHTLIAEKEHGNAFGEVPPRFRFLVQQLCHRDPARRPTAARARELIAELERRSTDPAGVAVTLSPIPVEVEPPAAEPPIDLGNLQLVDLDERDDARETVRPAPTARVAAPVFEPPASLAEAAAPLELEAIAKPTPPQPRVADSVRPPRRGGSGAGGLLALLLVVAAGGAAYYWFAVRARPQPTGILLDSMPGDHSVSIRIVGKPGTPITIDGKQAGKTPLSLKREAGTRPIEIGAPGFRRAIVPDRDQTVDISK